GLVVFGEVSPTEVERSRAHDPDPARHAADYAHPPRRRWADAAAPVGPVVRPGFRVPTAGRLGIAKLAVVAPSFFCRSPMRRRSRPERSVRRGFRTVWGCTATGAPAPYSHRPAAAWAA